MSEHRLRAGLPGPFRLFRAALLAGLGALVGQVLAQAVIGPAPSAPPQGRFAIGPGPAGASGREVPVADWLMRMHEASRRRNYVGTFVVSSSGGAMSSGRIWHACDGTRQVERVELLTGAPRSMFRRDGEVLTFIPEERTVRAEPRESLGLFPDLLKANESAIPEFYGAHQVGQDRVAGFEADVVQLAPKDGLRFGYRVWSEKKSGLVVKVQTLDAEGRVLEQAAFTELQLDAPLRFDRLAQAASVPRGWRVERAQAQKTTAAAEGWTLRTQVAGFRPLSCYKRPSEGVLQWVFSDGLASVSLFVEAYDAQRHREEGLFAAGATHTLTRRIQDWWLTAVGEVPPRTLEAFAHGLERSR